MFFLKAVVFCEALKYNIYEMYGVVFTCWFPKGEKMGKKNKLIDRGRVIKIIQTLLCVAYVVFMSVQVIVIFNTGTAARTVNPRTQIYTPEIAADALLKGLPVLVAAAIVTVIAAVLGIRNNEKPYNDLAIIRDLAVSLIKEPTVEMKAERAKQKKLHIGGWAGFTLSMLPIVLYMTNSNNFEKNDYQGLEQVIFSMLVFILPWTLIGIGILAVAFILEDKSIKKETDLAKSCEKKAAEKQPVKKCSKAVLIVRCALLVISVIFIILGINNGGANAVLTKAITICTECIGLG